MTFSLKFLEHFSFLSFRIACVSCPTVYTHLLDASKQTNNIYLFEFDKRFQGLYQDHFIFYDYNDPLKIPEEFASFFDVVLADPPYLSQECLEKTLQAVQYIAKDKIVLCTGIVIEVFILFFIGSYLVQFHLEQIYIAQNFIFSIMGKLY